jgi:hypothetical protein
MKRERERERERGGGARGEGRDQTVEWKAKPKLLNKTCSANQKHLQTLKV